MQNTQSDDLPDLVKDCEMAKGIPLVEENAISFVNYASVKSKNGFEASFDANINKCITELLESFELLVCKMSKVRRSGDSKDRKKNLKHRKH